MGASPQPPTGDRTQPTSRRQRTRNFVSLQWYEETIKFLFTFTAKTSEILLAAGLVTSTANFLTDGKVMGDSTALASAWAWAQALAIDSSLGVTFAYVFTSIKQRDWLKVLCYGLLTCLLAFVAGTITNVDTLSHAIHLTMTNATVQVGLNVKLLTTLRAIAVVGFVLMSRLKDVSFKELYEQSPASPSSSTPIQLEEVEARILRMVTEALTQQSNIKITEEQGGGSLSENQPVSESLQGQREISAPRPNTEREPAEQDALERENHSSDEQANQLRLAYQELKTEGKRISGRALAARAHLRRSTCTQWLALHHPESVDERPEKESEYEQQ